MPTIYKICSTAAWREAETLGVFRGYGIDLDDGYIHFSTETQVAETAARHFAGEDDLILVAVDANRLGDALRWEPARSGDLFPHLYEPLAATDILWAKALPRGANGQLQFPALEE